MMRGVGGDGTKGGLLGVYIDRDTFRSRLQCCYVRPVRDGGKDSRPLLLGLDSAGAYGLDGNARLQQKQVLEMQESAWIGGAWCGYQMRAQQCPHCRGEGLRHHPAFEGLNPAQVREQP